MHANSQPMKPSVALIGAGLAGSSLLLGLQRVGFEVIGVASRTRQSAERCVGLLEGDVPIAAAETLVQQADWVIIATPDDVITTLCEQLAEAGWRSGQWVCHLSGALHSGALAPASAQGAKVLSMHPVQTFADPENGADSLAGTFFTLEGDAQAIAAARQAVAELGGYAIEIEAQQKPLYHAALCVASNYLVSLADTAVQFLVQAGIEEEQALPMILPLMNGAMGNLHTVGLPNALTGPISRGDANTIDKHLAFLEEEAPGFLPFYQELGRHTQRVAKAKGKQNPEGAKRLETLLG